MRSSFNTASTNAPSELTRARISRASCNERGFLPRGHWVSTCRASFESGSVDRVNVWETASKLVVSVTGSRATSSKS